MQILNQEHLEARQEQINKIIDEFKDSLLPEDLAKYEAVSQAMKILSDAKVPAYLFPYLRTTNHAGHSVIQYNNIVEVATKFDSAGKLTEESIEFNKKFHTSFWGSILSITFYAWFQDGKFSWQALGDAIFPVMRQGEIYNRTGKCE